MAAIQKCGFLLMEDSPYSPDLAPCDYYLFLKIKKSTSVVIIDVMNAGDHFLRDQNGTPLTEGIHLLHDHWTKCGKITASDFLKLTPPTLGHRLINRPSYIICGLEINFINTTCPYIMLRPHLVIKLFSGSSSVSWTFIFN